MERGFSVSCMNRASLDPRSLKALTGGGWERYVSSTEAAPRHVSVLFSLILLSEVPLFTPFLRARCPFVYCTLVGCLRPTCGMRSVEEGVSAGAPTCLSQRSGMPRARLRVPTGGTGDTDSAQRQSTEQLVD